VDAEKVKAGVGAADVDAMMLLVYACVCEGLKDAWHQVQCMPSQTQQHKPPKQVHGPRDRYTSGEKRVKGYLSPSCIRVG